MPLKMTFLGSGSAFTIDDGNFQSNILLQLDNNTLLLDAGTDIRFSLKALQLDHLDIQNVYISHLHSDHAGGLEWLALRTFFDPLYVGKPGLFISEKILEDLWNKTLSGGLSTLATQQASIHTFFN